MPPPAAPHSFQSTRWSPDPEKRYEEVAAALGQPLGTSHVFRLRQCWRQQLFEQVAMTLDAPQPRGDKRRTRGVAHLRVAPWSAVAKRGTSVAIPQRASHRSCYFKDFLAR